MFDAQHGSPGALALEPTASEAAAPPVARAAASPAPLPSATKSREADSGLLQYIPKEATQASSLPVGLTAMRLLELAVGSGERRARVRDRTSSRELEITIADEVEQALLERALMEQQFVLVEFQPGHSPCLLGIVQTRLPQQIHLRGEDLTLEGSRSVTLSSGRAGLKLHADGHVELLGTRVSAVSRGVMRLIGRALRLN